MKNLLRAAAALAAITLSTPALAQQGTARPEPKIGIGVGLTSSIGVTGSATATPDLGYLFFVPINVAPNFRIEPLIGWARQDTDATGKDSDFTLGIGAFYVQPLAQQLQLYAGGRLGSRWVSHKDAAYGAPGTTKDERRDTLLALAAGAEYLPIPRVALGAEFQIGYVSIGDTTVTSGPTGAQASGGGGSGSATQATLFARFYLF